MLKVEDLKVSFQHKGKDYSALQGVSFEVKNGEIVGLVGESGCGKSLTALSIMKLLPFNADLKEGKVEINGRDIVGLSIEQVTKIRGKEIAMIFQDPMTALNPLYKVGKQIEEAYTIHNNENKQEAYEKTLDIMRKVGLSRVEELYNEYPHQLSGGMRQRIMIAMALINNPSVLIADEPTTALDVTIQAQIIELISNMNKELGTSIIFVSHNLGVIRELCHRVIIMYSGNIVEEGKVEDIFTNPKHPYTKGLINSIPTPNKKGEKLYSIKGTVPSLYNRSQIGCCFADRCDRAESRCHTSIPHLFESDEHKIRCFKA